MNDDLSKKKVLIYDGGGLFVSLALRLAAMDATAKCDRKASTSAGPKSRGCLRPWNLT